tara:strand:+ start:29 stop:514 length:486 start_codon:yes stop_codon:yes gene_type:complete
MELELFNTRLKYDDDMLWRWVYTNGGYTLKNPYWRIVKETPNKHGYSRVDLDGKMYMYHRVVYKVCNPEWNIYDVSRENEIDHICGVRPKDNRIENLRVLNHHKNNCNNLHFVKGYTFNKVSNKYKAQIRINGKTINLGSYDTPEEAHAAYLKAKPLYHII